MESGAVPEAINPPGGRAGAPNCENCGGPAEGTVVGGTFPVGGWLVGG